MLQGLLSQVELSPSQVNAFLGEMLKGIGPMTVVGEVQRVSVSGPGHVYWTLADPEGVVQCVTWASQRDALGELVEGAVVKAQVKSPWFADRKSEVKLNVVRVEALGEGDLARRAEEVLAKLKAEGLLDRKRPLPYLPRAIGLVSGRGSDGLADVVRSIHERFPARIVFCGSLVQGVGAVSQIELALKTLEAHPDVDVIVIARGGGSAEDRAVFNEEALARAVFRSTKPVVTAIGHTNDVHVVDEVADLSCRVPSLVGEAVVPLLVELDESLQQARLALSAEGHQRLMLDRLDGTCQGLERGWRDAAQEIGLLEGRLDGARRQLGQATGVIAQARRDLDHTRRTLKGLDAFERGFAVVMDSEGRPVSGAGQLQVGAEITVRLRDGQARTLVEEVEMDDIDGPKENR